MAGAGGTTDAVLVIDDDPIIRSILRRALEEQAFSVREAEDGVTGLASIRAEEPALVILDLGLPGTNGLDVLRAIRSRGELPVIILTARDDPLDRVTGLELGADDYVSKPFTPREVTARVRSVLRRSAVTAGASSRAAPHPASTLLESDGLRIDVAARDVVVDGSTVELTAREFDLLVFMAQSPRQVFSRAALLDQVWRSQTDWQDPDTVTEHIHRLRRKIEPDAKRPRWIVTVRGAGYRFEP